MNANEQAMLTMLKSGVTGQAEALPEGFEPQALYNLIKRHNVQALAFAGGVRCGLDRKSQLMQHLFQQYGQCALVSDRQLAAVKKIFDAFQENGIDFMPVKGCNMKSLYPSPELRPMGDADILIRMEQYEKIKPIMESLGFAFKLESDHELVWVSPQLEAELHKRLIPSYNEDYSAYYGNGWRLASRSDGTRFYMTPEDEYIYIFTHFAKHYRDGGIGVCHVIDLWILCEKRAEMDLAYIRGELQKLELLEFYKNVCSLIDYWFRGQPGDPKTEFLSAFILSSGIWGTALNHTLSEGVKGTEQAGSARKMRSRRVMGSVFPPLSVMRGKYPVLEKWPVLLPFTWVHRDVGAVLFRQKNVSRCLGKTHAMTDEAVSDYEKSLRYVGLQFRFEEK